MTYDLIIVGGGPAGAAAGVYAARKQLTTLLITKDFGGQSIVSPDIHNWIGTPSISGEALAKSLQEHVEQYEGEHLTIARGALAQKVEGDTGAFTVTTDTGDTYEAKTVLIAAGAARRKLTIPGAEEFDQKGLTYCATCDGPMFSDMDVAVIGGGNAGFESAAQLLAYVKSVTLLDIGDSFKAEPITVEKVLEHPNMTGVTNAETLEVVGDKMVTGLRYRDTKSGEEKQLKVQGIFVEIGIMPNTGMLEGLVDLDEYKHVKVDPRTQQTSMKGIWAAGDVTDGLYAQNNIAVGDAVKAVEDIYVYLKA